MNRISPTLVQDWATQAHKDGLSPRSVRKYHVLLSSIFVRAVKDRVLVYNPCDHTELPKIITRKARTLTPDEYLRLLAAMPAQFHLMVETLIETGLRWGELIALKPRHIDFLRRSITIEETIVEISKAHSPPPASATSPSPTRKTTNPGPSASAKPGSTPSSNTSPPTASGTTTSCSPPRPAPRSPATPSAPASGCPPSRPPTSTSASTTCARPTPPGYWPEEPTSSPSWTAWATPRSRPPEIPSHPPGHRPTQPRRPQPRPDSTALTRAGETSRSLKKHSVAARDPSIGGPRRHPTEGAEIGLRHQHEEEQPQRCTPAASAARVPRAALR